MKRAVLKIFQSVVSVGLFLIGFLVCLYLNGLYQSCQVSHSEPEALTFQDSLKLKILQYGDTTAYHAMKETLAAKNLPHELWFYSIVMAKQYHYPPANEDVVEILQSLHSQYPALGGIDSVSEKIVSEFINLQSANNENNL